MKNLREFHDPQYDRNVEEAHDFVAGTLGLDVVGPKKVAIVPYYNKHAAGKAAGRPLVPGQYDIDRRNIVVVAGPNDDDVSVTTRVVRELAHDATLRTRKAQKAHEFIKEALAGIAEAQFLDQMALEGRRSVPEARVVLGALSFYVPGRYARQAPSGEIMASQGALAASAMSMVSQLSGISERDILSAVPGRRSRHIDLMEQSLNALGHGTADDLRGYPNSTEGVRRAAADIGDKAVRYGAIMENHDEFASIFPPVRYSTSPIQ